MGTSTATSPPASNTSTVTEATTEPVFPAQPPMTPFPVVRVFGTATNESQPLPAAGVCDYTFYDGLYDTGPFDTLYSPHFSAPVEHVLSHASLHSVTEYGLSFAYRNASQVARDLEIPEKGSGPASETTITLRPNGPTAQPVLVGGNWRPEHGASTALCDARFFDAMVALPAYRTTTKPKNRLELVIGCGGNADIRNNPFLYIVQLIGTLLLIRTAQKGIGPASETTITLLPNGPTAAAGSWRKQLATGARRFVCLVRRQIFRRHVGAPGIPNHYKT
ncbi:hypothetical protein MRX96_017165 [Rhipicephalus microplus]